MLGQMESYSYRICKKKKKEKEKAKPWFSEVSD